MHPKGEVNAFESGPVYTLQRAGRNDRSPKPIQVEKCIDPAQQVIERDQILKVELIEGLILLTDRLPHHRRSPVPETVGTKESHLGNGLNRVLQQPKP